MTVEYQIHNGQLLWARNPFNGVVSYVVDVANKNFDFTLGPRNPSPPKSGDTLDRDIIQRATASCPFCPGNENHAPPELLRVTPEEIPGWSSGAGLAGAPWVIRVFNNLFPRIPQQLTGGRNESYVVVEDPRHFVDEPSSLDDLMLTGLLSEEHFYYLLAADVRVMRRADANPKVRSIVVRKNQGRESGASQPHLHQQIIGSPWPLPAVETEARAQHRNPKVWDELLELVERADLVIDKVGEVISYISPVGAFPRSYDVVLMDHRGVMSELSAEELRPFARALYRILKILRRMPLDYEIHQGDGVPLHAHINARGYPYSNVAGTLNIPKTVLESAGALRKALTRA